MRWKQVAESSGQNMVETLQKGAAMFCARTTAVGISVESHFQHDDIF